ncbi:MAG TPA: hypothetical protein VF727_08355 [Allosphingosinicella sp.]|jgi:hypothetical protein
MTCYRFLLAQPQRRPGFLDAATIDQEPGSILIAREYAVARALELWREPWQALRLSPANDAEPQRRDAGREAGHAPHAA